MLQIHIAVAAIQEIYLAFGGKTGVSNILKKDISSGRDFPVF